MNNSVYNITLDIQKIVSQISLEMSKGDNGCKLIIALADGTSAYTIADGCTAVFRAKKPDGTYLYNYCTIENNTITCNLSSQVTAAEGLVECEINLYGADHRSLTSSRFTIVVQAGVYEDNIVESTDEFTALQKAISDVLELHDSLKPITVSDVSESTEDEGNNVVTFSDGSSLTVKNGSKGVKGDSITVSKVTESNEDSGENIVTFSDGSSLTVKNGGKGNKGDIGASVITLNASGEIIFANDVSPVEHDLKVSVASKNLIPYPYAQTTVTQNGITFTDNGDGSITINGTATAQTYFGVVATSSPLKLEKGKTYTLSGFPTGHNLSTAYLNIRNTTYQQHIRCSGDSVTFTAEYTDYYSQIYINSGVTLDNVVVRPQLEEGSTATEYTPYIADLTAVNVTRMGKNLIPYPYYQTTMTKNGITFTDNGDGSIHVSGTATANATLYLWFYKKLNALKSGNTYIPSTSAKKTLFMCNYQNSNNTEKNFTTTSKGAQIYPNEAVKDSIYLLVQNGTTVDETVYPMLELGSTATKFEKYKEPQTATANADGIVDGLKSVSPNMTVFADKGVNIDLVYNADTKTYIDNKFAELQNAVIASLGGEISK